MPIEGLGHRAALLLALFLAVAAPLPFGAVRPGARSVLAILIGAGLLFLWIDRRRLPLPPARFAWLALATIALALFYVVPLPAGVVGALSPRLLAEARASLASAGEDPALAGAERAVASAAGGARDETTFLPPAVDRDASIEGTTRLVIALGAFLLGLFAAAADRTARRRIAGALGVSAFVQAAYGLAENLSGSHSIFGWHNPYYPGLATGTFVCPNHTADVLILGLFSLLGLLLVRDRDPGRHPRARTDDRAARGARLAVGLTAAGLAVIALLWSSSRAALGSSVFGFALLGALLVLRRDGPRRRWGVLALGALLVAVLVTGAVLLRPVEPLVDDLEQTVPGYTARARLFRVAADVARTFPVVGTGPGTFDIAHRFLRSPDVGARITHAHSDWLQWWAETGVPGLLLLGGWLVALVLGSVAVWRRHRDGALTAALAAGLLVVALHAGVEFSLQLPGVTVPAALAAGALLAPLRWRPADDRPGSGGPLWPIALAVVSLVLFGAAAATGIAMRELPRVVAGAPPGLATPEQLRRWARAEVEELLAAAKSGQAVPRAKERAGLAWRAAQSAARRAPLRSEFRITQWETLQALAAAHGAAALPETTAALAPYYLGRAVELDPANRKLRLQVAKYWIALGDGSRARREVRALLEMAPLYAPQAYATLGGPDLELADLMEATPNTPQAAVQLGSFLAWKKRDLPAAQIVLDRALARAPRDGGLRRHLGLVLGARQRWEEALGLLDDSALSGDDKERRGVLQVRAQALAALRRTDELEQTLVELERLGEDPRVVALARARGRSASGDASGAIELMRQALAKPGRPLTPAQRLDLLLALGREQNRAGRFRDALETFRRASQIAPDHPEVHAFFARIDQGAPARP